MRLLLSNSDPEGRPAGRPPATAATLQGLGLANAFTVKQRDTLTLPYGVSLNGKIKQVFTREGAQEMVAALENEKAKDPDFGIPIYIGHPDVPDLSRDYPDKAAYAWIYNMEATDAGLVLHPKWSQEGEALLANAKYRFPSPYWSCRVDAGKANVAYPVQLMSVGLTNRPNIRAIGALVNEASKQQGETEMKELLLKLLGLANEATDEQIQAAAKDVDVPALKLALANESAARAADKATHETALANSKGDLQLALSASAKLAEDAKTAKAESDKAIELANTALKAERAGRIELLVNAAVSDGRVTLADKPKWLADLAADFDGNLVALANAKQVLHTESKTKDLGTRKAEALSRTDRVLALVNERMTKNREDYLTAFTNVKKDNAALFAEMNKPKAG